MTPVQTYPVSPASGSKGWAILRALRVHQWVKNLLLFVPLVLDHKVLRPAATIHTLVAFAAFCCAASGGYILNDLLDREADRLHPTKRQRPFASGALPAAFGWIAGPLLIGLGLALGALVLSWKFLVLLALYVAATAAYSTYLKRIAVVDVLVLAGLYTLRVLAGVAAAHVRFSAWLLAFSMFLFLSLAFLKRYTEFRSLDPGTGAARRRGYVPGDREWLGTMGSASGYLSVLVLALYISSDQVVSLYRTPEFLWLVCPVLLFWISRMWLLAYRGQIDDDPIVSTVRDPLSYLLGTLVGIILFAAL